MNDYEKLKKLINGIKINYILDINNLYYGRYVLSINNIDITIENNLYNFYYWNDKLDNYYKKEGITKQDIIKLINIYINK